MPQTLYSTHKSPRHGIEFDRVPTVKASIRGGSKVKHRAGEYGPILDCVLEMADDISTGNGVSVESAVSQVLADEGWRILPTHRAAIVARLTQQTSCAWMGRPASTYTTVEF